MRIISVVPSITELLYSLGLDEEVVEITKFCVHPQHWFKNKQRVGGTKDLKIDLIRELKPDLIIANREENKKEDIEACMRFCKVYLNDVSTFDEALEMIMETGSLTGKEQAANSLISQIKHSFEKLTSQPKPDLKVVYLIWKDPIMTVGGDTFINDMLRLSGFENIFANQSRYPVLTEEELVQCNPDVLFLSSEPYPFSEKHLPYFRSFLPATKIVFVDGEMFSWYGSRMRHAAEYFMEVREQC